MKRTIIITGVGTDAAERNSDARNKQVTYKYCIPFTKQVTYKYCIPFTKQVTYKYCIPFTNCSSEKVILK